MDDLEKLLENAGITEDYDFGYTIEITHHHVIIRDEGSRGFEGSNSMAMTIAQFETIVKSFLEQTQI